MIDSLLHFHDWLTILIVFLGFSALAQNVIYTRGCTGKIKTLKIINGLAAAYFSMIYLLLGAGVLGKEICITLDFGALFIRPAVCAMLLLMNLNAWAGKPKRAMKPEVKRDP